MCGENSAAESAVVLTGTHIVDKVLYAALGSGGGTRHTLYDFANPVTSPVCECIDRLTGMLLEFGAGSDQWLLLELVGGDFDDPSLRLYARRGFLQLMCGVMDMLDRLLALPPHNMVNFCNGEPADIASDVYDALKRENPLCLPHIARQLVNKYPNTERMLNEGRHAVKFYLDHGQVSLDEDERSHGSIRREMKSGGKAKCHTLAGNRHFVKEVRAEHVKRGGDEQVSLGVIKDIELPESLQDGDHGPPTSALVALPQHRDTGSRNSAQPGSA